MVLSTAWRRTSLTALLLLALSACNPGQPPDETTSPAATADAQDEERLLQDPAQVGQRYYDLLAAGSFDQAYAMWASDTPIREDGLEHFQQSMLAYQDFEGETTAAARTDGAAGTLHAEVPVRVSGTRQGATFSHEGTMQLRRCNDVPGCTEEELRWRIGSINLE